MSLKQVIITVPVYRLPLTPDEKTSIRHLRHYLGGFDITIIAPESLHLAEPLLADLPVMRFDPAYFKGIAGYNQLMLSTEFYRRFQKYEYILIYQLDCLVFSSDLSAWCQKGWDYVGAPCTRIIVSNPMTRYQQKAYGRWETEAFRYDAFRLVWRCCVPDAF